MSSSAAILGCSGLTLTLDEIAFFKGACPWGFILFKRNIDNPQQVLDLTRQLRFCVGRDDAPVFIDQEGGRVQRMGPPHWPVYPPGAAYGALYRRDPVMGREMTRLGARLMAQDLRKVGIDGDCLPVLDVPVEGAHDVIGNRAYGDDASTIAILGRAAAEGLLAGSVLPVIKHIPGHGRAGSDSHHELPLVQTSRAELEAQDFAPFRILSDMPLAMTAHVIYAAIDADNPCTTSPVIIQDVIRTLIGFDGLLMSDDLSMKALSGDFASRTRQSLQAGCDIVLHCNGVMDEMKAITDAIFPLKGKALERANRALSQIRHQPEPFPEFYDEAKARLAFNEAFVSMVA
jgi:beta-N-acetylhexosaminidase